MQVLHRTLVHGQRVRRLATLLAPLFAERARVLDVGSGDGTLAAALLALRPDLSIEGVDVLVRPGAAIPIRHFDGMALPFADRAYDAVLTVDVLHHAADPPRLFAECVRVAGRQFVIKDHLADDWLAVPRLKLMDYVGNAAYGVALPYQYWPRARWQQAIDTHALTASHWNEALKLYPWPADWLFGRGLHFVADLRPA